MKWIGVHVEMFPLCISVDHKHPTPSILGHTMFNPSIDDKKCLQRSLLLANEGGYKIIANRSRYCSGIYYP